jgi:hypothetical protein
VRIQGGTQAAVRGESLPYPVRLLPGLTVTLFTRAWLAALAIGMYAPQWASAAPAVLPHSRLAGGDARHAAPVIDLYLAGLWQGAEIDSAAVVDDVTFLRRASLALIGMPPTADEVLAFNRDLATDKREVKVNELLKQSRYADYWAFRQRQWIVDLRESVGQGTDFVSLYQYLRASLAENRKWDVVARDLVATQGAIQRDGRANFGIFFDGESNEYAEAAMRLFLGTNLACAQCHDDPYVEQYKRESYWGLSAFFGRIEMWDPNVVAAERFAERFPDIGRSEQSISTLPGGDAAIDGARGENRALVDVDTGEVQMPEPQGPQTMIPTPLGGEPMPRADEGSKTRRELFADWLTGPQSQNMARAIVNRYFLELTGRGFVDRADGFAPGKPVRHPALLEQIAEKLVVREFDTKWLIRTIVLSRLFQLEFSDEPAAQEMWHAARQRRLNSDQWCNSILRVTGREEAIYLVGEQVRGLLQEETAHRIDQRQELLIQGEKELRAGPFPHYADRLPAPPGAFVQSGPTLTDQQREEQKKTRQTYITFGQNLSGHRSGARTEMSPTSEALMKMNGALLAESLSQGTSVAEIESLESSQAKIEQAYLTVLARLPGVEESQEVLAMMEENAEFKISDLLWALIQTNEFQSM